MSYAGERVWVVGASAGIGEALARELAARGASLVLSARNADKLAALAGELGPGHETLPLDVADRAQVSAAVAKLAHDPRRLDRVIFMAAVYQPADIIDMDLEAARQMVEVNLLGALSLSVAVLPLLMRQGAGQLALCGSVAAYTGLPGGQPYSATKAAVRNFAESLRAEAPPGVDVRLISPGFVRTRMTDRNDFHMPMRVEPEQAAQAIADGLCRSGFEIHFPKMFTLSVKLLALLPYSLTLWLTRRMRNRGGD